jgi:hypothetical protein
MPSSSERTFGQRYTKTRELIEYLETLPTYSPGNPDLEPANLTPFLDSVDTANNDAASKLSVLSTEREARYNLYKADNGLIKRCSQIRDYVASIHPDGKKSLDYKKVQRAVQSMRGIRISKKPPAGSPAKTASTSEVSFGSMLKVGKDVLEVIKLVPGYAPSNTNLTVLNYTAFVASVDAKNSVVAEKLEEYDNSVEARLSLYDELDDRIRKIRLALAAQYGKDSNEYKDSLKF